MIKSLMIPWQQELLFNATKTLQPKRILELGTFVGASAKIMSEAAPDAEIITLNPQAHEVAEARTNLKAYCNITVIQTTSVEYLGEYDGSKFDMIFVDGDHKHFNYDKVWYNSVSAGGLFLCHDYSPVGTSYACPPVYNGLRAMAKYLGREPDIIEIRAGAGMAGFYKRAKEVV